MNMYAVKYADNNNKYNPTIRNIKVSISKGEDIDAIIFILKNLESKKVNVVEIERINVEDATTNVSIKRVDNGNALTIKTNTPEDALKAWIRIAFGEVQYV